MKTEKRCRVCREVKLAENFYADRSSSDGLQGRCKSCGTAAAKALWAERKRKIDELPPEQRPVSRRGYHERKWGPYAWRDPKLCRKCDAPLDSGKRRVATVRGGKAYYYPLCELHIGLHDRRRNAIKRAKPLGIDWKVPVGQVCAICGLVPRKNRELCVDHCHERNVFRGYLCHGCNRAIGFLRDDPGRCRKAADYLEEFLKKHSGG